MLKAFFGSKTRVKLLGLFLLHPKNEYFIRELTRILKEQINSIRRELDNLKKVGFLKTYSKNRKKYYYLNPEFAFIEEFRSIFAKTDQPHDEIVKAISSYGSIQFLLLTGQFVGGSNTEADMLIVGDVNKEELKKYVEKELAAGKGKLKYAVMSQGDFLYRLDLKDKFVIDMLSAKDKIVPVNDLKKFIDARTQGMKVTV